MALDLGALAMGLGTAYFNSRAPQINVASGYPPGGGFQMPAAGIPFYDVIPEAGGTAGCGPKQLWDPAANCGTGKWVTKRRRRHRNLATRGDIRDLSALKGVLGQGKLLETWIATHS